MIRRLCQSNNLRIRVKTHQAQQRPDEVVEMAVNWLIYMRPVCSAHNVEEKFIINMDQTPVPFNLAPNRTLATKGLRTVGIRRTGNSTKRATVALAITASGEKLKPMVVFKGSPNGLIARRELPTYDTRDKVECRCQKAAWQDGELILDWIDCILVPFLQQKNPQTEVVFMWDNYKGHVAAETKAKLAELGIHPYIIPGECTSLVQPLDVGVNRPFKAILKSKWWDWVISQEITTSVFKDPSRKNVAEWVDESWEGIGSDIIKNAWRKTDFSYFAVDEE